MGRCVLLSKWPGTSAFAALRWHLGHAAGWPGALPSRRGGRAGALWSQGPANLANIVARPSHLRRGKFQNLSDGIPAQSGTNSDKRAVHEKYEFLKGRFSYSTTVLYATVQITPKVAENGIVFPFVQPTTFATVIFRPQNFHRSTALDNGYRTVPVCMPVHAYQVQQNYM
eukprot:COSAG05_NODE_5262_length_1221_cov_1.557932_1_plen_170_part_00